MKKQISVAIIDDGINENVYNTPLEGANIEILDDLSIIERRNYDKFLPSHGTTCAAIVNLYGGNVIFHSIKILNDKTKKGVKGQLIKALYWCAENKIHIANLSLGTIDFRDFEEIKNCINAVTMDKVIVVAACNNKNIFTYPACLPNVLGVRCRASYLEDQFCINDNIFTGIDFTASGRHYLTNAFGNSFFTNPSNSFAAPLITAKVSALVRENVELTLDDIKKELYKGVTNFNTGMNMYCFYEAMRNPGSPEYISVLERSISKSEYIDIPVIRILFDDSCMIDDSLFFLEDFNKLFRQDGYYSIGITNMYMKTFDDLEYFPQSAIKEKRFLSYICKKYNCDLILLGYVRKNKVNLDTNSVEENYDYDMQIFISMDESNVNKSKQLIVQKEGDKIYFTLNPKALLSELKCLYHTIIGLFSQDSSNDG